MHPSAHPSPQLDQTASRSVQPFLHSSPQCRWAFSGMFWKLRLRMGQSRPHLTRCSLSKHESKSQMAFRSVQPFLHSLRQRVSILYNGPPLFPLKLLLPMEGSGPPSNTWFFGPTESSTQMLSQLVQPFLQGSLLWQTDRPTNRPH